MMNAENEQGIDPNSNLFQAIMDDPLIQRTISKPETFYGRSFVY